jgi:hypothetical protein
VPPKNRKPMRRPCGRAGQCEPSCRAPSIRMRSPLGTQSSRASRLKERASRQAGVFDCCRKRNHVTRAPKFSHPLCVFRHMDAARPR